MQKAPVAIPFPLSTFPGANPQEGAGRLINCIAEPLGEPSKPSAPAPQVWKRQPGLSLFKNMGQSGYRGGLVVSSIAYEAFANNISTVDATPTSASLGAFPGTKPISIARNQATPPNVIGVDVDNGAYRFDTGVPLFFNSGGTLPQPNSICFQDGYMFFTIGDNRVFATGVNTIVVNALTFITVQKKSDVTLLRGVGYNSLLWLFTTGHCEIWQDTAQPFPGFPYSYLTTVNYGLLQPSAIAGFETGFDQLLWVAQDFGVYWAKDGSQQPLKASPPDLDRKIAAAQIAGQQLWAYCYTFAGKKFWVITCAAAGWTWEINLNTSRWNERDSLAAGIYGAWRAQGAHQAFGKYLVGDSTGNNLLFVDPSAYTENAVPIRFRLESGPVHQFPQGERICRADIDADLGTGIPVGTFRMNVSGAVGITGVGSTIRLTVDNTALAHTLDIVQVTGIAGTVEANGTWPIVVEDSTHILLTGSNFQIAYLAGGVAVDITSPPNVVAPVAAISISKDGGLTWGNPLTRALGQQGRTRRARLSVKNMGLAPPFGARWRIDVTDAVYVGILGGTQSNSPLDPGSG